MLTKKCTKCNEEMAISEFVRDSQKKDGYQSCCKNCKNHHYLSKKGGKLCTPKERYEKTKSTFLKKFGVENPSQIPAIVEKKRTNFKERYGVKHHSQLDHIKEKIKQTNIQKYGVENPRKNKEIIDKTKKTVYRKYGTTCTLQADSVKEKSRKTLLKNYGVTNPSKSKIIREKVIQTNLTRYGVRYPRQSQAVLDVIRERQVTEGKVLTVTWEGKLISLTELCDICDRSYSRALKILQQYGEEYLLNWIKEIKKNARSFYEDLLIKYIQSVKNTKIETNIRTIIKPKEIDIYLPEYKLGIEVHGHYYHSDEYVDLNYHKLKSDLSDNAGITLLQIFDVDIEEKLEIVKSIISGKLGLSTRIYARNCEIRSIDNQQYRTFLNENHFQGYAPAVSKLGLFYEDELISVMSFSKSRYSKENKIELIRLCYKKGVSVIGGASKLFNYYIKEHPNIEHIISFCERDLFNGSVYEKLGFKLISVNPPSYFYVKNNKKHNRLSFQKHKLSSILPIFDPNLTEKQNMKVNGYKIIYTSGQKVYQWSKSNVLS